MLEVPSWSSFMSASSAGDRHPEVCDVIGVTSARVRRSAQMFCLAVAAWAAAPQSSHWAIPAASAQDGGFTFRTVKPPGPGARKRIVFGAAPQKFRSRATSYDWFWADVPAAITAADPARLDAILVAHGDRFEGVWPGYGGPDRARGVLREHGAALDHAVERSGVSLALLLAVIGVESGGRPAARSHAGAQGLMQLMPGTARRFGVRDPWDPAQNIAGGAAYLDTLLKMFDEDAVLALAAYNAGENAVLRHKGVPPYAETRDYVAKVLANFHGLRRICASPPRGPRETCDVDPGA
jgi:soluble lytic murein transglycosylase-like protein